MLFILFFGIGIDSESSVGEDTIHITIYGTSVLVEKTAQLKYLFRAHKTHCPPGKDIRADFSGLSRLCELFRRLILLGNKKISSRDGMDLNYANTIWRER